MAEIRHDQQLWFQAVDVHTLSPNWRLHMEVAPRFSQHASELDHVIVRWAVGRRLTDRVSLWAGHAWVPRALGPGVRHEQRPWEQVLVVLPTTYRLSSSLRVRVEQRFLEGWADSSHRVRTLLRGVHPLGTGKWWGVAWDEAMFNVDNTAGGPSRGFDQNRLFGGVFRRLSPRAGVEVGYMLHTVNAAGPVVQQGHTLLTVLNLSY